MLILMARICRRETGTLRKLFREVAGNTGIERIRFQTSHPKDLSDELIEAMAVYQNICRHLHLPVQSGSSRVLELMNRDIPRNNTRS